MFTNLVSMHFFPFSNYFFLFGRTMDITGFCFGCLLFAENLPFCEAGNIKTTTLYAMFLANKEVM